MHILKYGVRLLSFIIRYVEIGTFGSGAHSAIVRLFCQQAQRGSRDVTHFFKALRRLLN